LRDLINVFPICAIFDREVLAFDEAVASQFLEKGHDTGEKQIARLRQQDTQTIGPPRLLRYRSERPCGTRARKGDELAPPHRFAPC
jgi:hypothetical protein